VTDTDTVDLIIPDGNNDPTTIEPPPIDTGTFTLAEALAHRPYDQAVIDAAWAREAHEPRPRKVVCWQCGASPLDGADLIHGSRDRRLVCRSGH
jgi:hypothetical protein